MNDQGVQTMNKQKKLSSQIEEEKNKTLEELNKEI